MAENLPTIINRHIKYKNGSFIRIGKIIDICIVARCINNFPPCACTAYVVILDKSTTVDIVYPDLIIEIIQ